MVEDGVETADEVNEGVLCTLEGVEVADEVEAAETDTEE